MGEWSAAASADLYRLPGWGDPYFTVNDQGHLEVVPTGDGGPRIDLYRLVSDLETRNLTLPLLIRFSDILADRIRRLNESFAHAIAEYEYPGVYRGVYPVKVNQQRHLIEEIVESGRPYHLGLEAGSKPELLIAVATLDTPDAIIVCNGYKDEEYIETALLARQLGKSPFIVIERLAELDVVLRAAEKLGVEPLLGVRAKLTAKGVGRWGVSTGDGSKFGLTSAEIVEMVTRLREAGMLHALRLLHFHIGSQISQIGVIKSALREATQFYTELVGLGAQMGYLDVGGGLGIDYDGSKTDFPASKNYNVQEYAYDVVSAAQAACERRGIPPPTLVSESGRALVSHQSVLVFDVLGASRVMGGEPDPPQSGDHQQIRDLWETYRGVDADNLQEAYHDAVEAKEETQTLFTLGYVGLEQRARAERLFWACCERILYLLRGAAHVPEELEDLEEILADTYYVNFSVFQSLPDSWAIDQLFPIMPIHRLEEEPTRRATLADLTCDSDGRIDRFIDLQDVKHVLELHEPNGEPYYLGAFLAGAYQESLSELHNLFGDTNVVHVHVTEGGYRLEQVIRGDTMAEVLHYVQYNPEGLLETVRRQAEHALQDGRLTLDQSRLLLQHYEDSLRGTTYLKR
ncbi:MAG: biosynthetic arginine decarboxylase [Dehalococcoidia bacterium]